MPIDSQISTKGPRGMGTFEMLDAFYGPFAVALGLVARGAEYESWHSYCLGLLSGIGGSCQAVAKVIFHLLQS